MARIFNTTAFLLIIFYFAIGLNQRAIAQSDTLSLNKSVVASITDTTRLEPQIKEDITQLNPPNLSKVISGPKIMWALILLISGYLTIRLSFGLLNAYALRNPKYSMTIKRVLPILRISAWSFLIYLIIVGIFRPQAATLLAFFASIGVAIGFAAQDMVKNLFGGLVVMFDRPFQVGDKIDMGDHYGEVIEIGIRATKIVTPDDSVITIPNGDFMSTSVSNSNAGENNCQVVAEIYLPLDIDTERVRKIAIEAAQISKYIYLNKPIVVLFFNEMHMTRSVYKMRLKAYVSDLSKEFAFKSEMTEIVIKTLIEEKIVPSDNFIE